MLCGASGSGPWSLAPKRSINCGSQWFTGSMSTCTSLVSLHISQLPLAPTTLFSVTSLDRVRTYPSNIGYHDRQAWCETTCQTRLCSSLHSFALISSHSLCFSLCFTPTESPLAFSRINIRKKMYYVWSCLFSLTQTLSIWPGSKCEWQQSGKLLQRLMCSWHLMNAWITVHFRIFFFFAVRTLTFLTSLLFFSTDVQCPSLQVDEWKFPQTARHNITGEKTSTNMHTSPLWILFMWALMYAICCQVLIWWGGSPCSRVQMSRRSATLEDPSSSAWAKLHSYAPPSKFTVHVPHLLFLQHLQTKHDSHQYRSVLLCVVKDTLQQVK